MKSDCPEALDDKSERRSAIEEGLDVKKRKGLVDRGKDQKDVELIEAKGVECCKRLKKIARKMKNLLITRIKKPMKIS